MNVAKGEQVDTIAVPAVLAAYNWAPRTDRYRKLALFVDAFFTKRRDAVERLASNSKDKLERICQVWQIPTYD